MRILSLYIRTLQFAELVITATDQN